MFLNERLQLPKRAIFPSLISGEGRFKFPIYFVQDAMNRSQYLKKFACMTRQAFGRTANTANRMLKNA